MATILIAEADKSSRLATSARLLDLCRIVTACDGIQALETVRKGGIDLVVADGVLPRMDGYLLLQTLREEGYTMPYLLLLPNDRFAEKRRAFLLGADDCLAKPFNGEELFLRVGALLRRANIAMSKKVEIGGIVVDSERYAVYTDSAYIELPKKEFEILFKLVSYPERVFTKEQLLDSIWGLNAESGKETVKTHINRIRNRMKDFEAIQIVTVKGRGYKADIKKVAM